MDAIKGIFKIFLFIVGVASSLCSLAYGYLAHLHKAVNPQTGGLIDGFGRELSPTPLFIRALLRSDSLWAGPINGVIDWVIIVGLAVVAVGAFYWCFKSAD